MSSPTLNQGIFTVDIRETQLENRMEPDVDPTLTARAMVAVTILGAGFWYVMWKTALHFLAGH